MKSLQVIEYNEKRVKAIKNLSVVPDFSGHCTQNVLGVFSPLIGCICDLRSPWRKQYEFSSELLWEFISELR